MADVRRLFRIQLVAIVLFAFVKHWLRPRVLAANAPPSLDIFVLSFPNFCEAIVGTIAVTAIALITNHRRLGGGFRSLTVYLVSTMAAGVYVILQEFKVHNLGGHNVYDPWDVAYSIIGLGTAFGILLWLQPRVPATRG